MRTALLHVSLLFALCAALASTRLFEDVAVDVTYAHYAERPVANMPAILAMPCNCLINLGYVCVGLYWLRGRDGEPRQSRYMREAFALMAIFYGPVQWVRLATLRRAPAVLDQWITLPIFAWVSAWIGVTERLPENVRLSHVAAVEFASILSYGLALVHELGFEVALGLHVAITVYKGLRVQGTHGDTRSLGFLRLAVCSCAGFVVLKLLDHWLAQFQLFQRFTGHFWSKVCDVLQFHYSFCFLTSLRHKTGSSD